MFFCYNNMNGTREEKGMSSLYKTSISKIILSTALAAAMIQPGQAIAEQRFSDLPSDHWAASAIQAMVDSGYVTGYEDGTFLPDRYIIQEEFVTLATNMLFGKPMDSASTEDEDSARWSDWAYDYLEQEKGINSLEEYWAFGGMKRGVELNRGEAARILYKLLNGNVEHMSTKKAVQYLYEENLTNGVYSDKGDYFVNFAPTERLTRAQAAVFLSKIKDYRDGGLSRSGASTVWKDGLADRIQQAAQKHGVQVTAASNPERYQVDVEWGGFRLDFQYDEYGYGDIGENWHLAIHKLDNSKINAVASILVELGLPMSETDARTLIKDIYTLEYGETGETYEIDQSMIYTSYYYGYHIHWGEKRVNYDTAVEKPIPYALFVNGQEKVGPGFNIHMDQVFSRRGEIYVPVHMFAKDMGGSSHISDDWSTVTVSMGNGYWSFEWDGVPKRDGSTYIGTSIGSWHYEGQVQGISKNGTLFVPLGFVDDFYPVELLEENGVTLVMIGTAPENPTANYFGENGQYPSTFDFDPLDPSIVYPGGWRAPQLTSVWSPDSEQNFEAFQIELGFRNGGREFSVPGRSKVLTIWGGGGKHDNKEVTLRLMSWGTPPGERNPTVSESFKIPVVTAQLFHFYFEEEWRTIWDYFNQNDIPEQFTLNGRKVDVSYYRTDGSLVVEVGHKQ
jgi:hypothetical protein